MLMNRPHPLDILADPGAYGDAGAISRYHNPDNYTRALGGVLRARGAAWRRVTARASAYWAADPRAWLALMGLGGVPACPASRLLHMGLPPCDFSAGRSLACGCSCCHSAGAAGMRYFAPVLDPSQLKAPAAADTAGSGAATPRSSNVSDRRLSSGGKQSLLTRLSPPRGGLSHSGSSGQLA